jgi:hypothetical protein
VVCVQVNHRYVGAQSPATFDTLLDDLRAGRLADDIPPHGTLVRVRRSVGLQTNQAEVATERAAMAQTQAARAAAASGSAGGGATS